mmetsp:Transcript_33530/g.90755  ORF Transcript_33530/g.90755 Transcript_33530/m.90755 type:complete len:379 (-) Transcript_33530:1114-2250(-)
MVALSITPPQLRRRSWRPSMIDTVHSEPRPGVWRIWTPRTRATSTRRSGLPRLCQGGSALLPVRQRPPLPHHRFTPIVFTGGRAGGKVHRRVDGLLQVGPLDQVVHGVMLKDRQVADLTRPAEELLLHGVNEELAVAGSEAVDRVVRAGDRGEGAHVQGQHLGHELGLHGATVHPGAPEAHLAAVRALREGLVRLVLAVGTSEDLLRRLCLEVVPEAARDHEEHPLARLALTEEHVFGGEQTTLHGLQADLPHRFHADLRVAPQEGVPLKDGPGDVQGQLGLQRLREQLQVLHLALLHLLVLLPHALLHAVQDPGDKVDGQPPGIEEAAQQAEVRGMAAVQLPQLRHGRCDAAHEGGEGHHGKEEHKHRVDALGRVLG